MLVFSLCLLLVRPYTKVPVFHEGRWENQLPIPALTLISRNIKKKCNDAEWRLATGFKMVR